MAVNPGDMLSHYRLGEKLGEGGMGVVYRAEDTKLRRQLAVKVLPPDLVGDEERRLRFLREARTAAAVNHPNIATIYEVDEADGILFIAMELLFETGADMVWVGDLDNAPILDEARRRYEEFNAFVEASS